MKRRESREIAFALLFEWSFQNIALDEMLLNATQARDLEIDAFAKELTQRTIDNCTQFDGLIETYSEKWKINRLSRVTLAALRLSLCELAMFDDIPVGATINEAVELVKKFGTEDEASYVNGILGGYARREKGEDIPLEAITGVEIEEVLESQTIEGAPSKSDTETAIADAVPEERGE